MGHYVQTLLNEKDYAKVLKICENNDCTRYRFFKDAILEKLERTKAAQTEVEKILEEYKEIG